MAEKMQKIPKLKMPQNLKKENWEEVAHCYMSLPKSDPKIPVCNVI